MTATEPRVTRTNWDDYNDIERIMDVATADAADPNGLIHTVKDNADAIFTWNYEKGERAKLTKLYEKAKTSQWNGETDLDWSIEVDPAQVITADDPGIVDWFRNNPESPLYKIDDKGWEQVRTEGVNWRLSQFMHGEQGALLCTAKLVETVPWIDAKYYAATQVVDEARHVEVFAKYLDTKLDGSYPINPHLRMLLDDIINDSRWDVTYLGMQIMVEGLALAAFGFMHALTEEPLLKKLLRYVMSDEARHVAFGVLSLQEVYEGLNQSEILERQEFAFESALRMRDRFLQQEVWERMDIDVRSMVELQLAQPNEQKEFQRLLFSKIVPNCKKLGLLDAGDGWLRDRFTDIGVIQFENMVDTTEEFLDFDAVSQDRQAEEAAG